MVDRMGGPGDSLVPAYAIVGLGGLALLVAFLRGAEPAERGVAAGTGLAAGV